MNSVFRRLFQHFMSTFSIQIGILYYQLLTRIHCIIFIIQLRLFPTLSFWSNVTIKEPPHLFRSVWKSSLNRFGYTAFFFLVQVVDRNLFQAAESLSEFLRESWKLPHTDERKFLRRIWKEKSLMIRDFPPINGNFCGAVTSL